jgi:Holliday junction resolvase-like predicted endonuclease
MPPKRSPSGKSNASRVAAEIWLAVNPMPAIRDMRFDAILVAPGKLPRHIPAAFETQGLVPRTRRST